MTPQQPTGGLEGLAVLVTGGGTGIGRACAERLAADGAAVTICGRTETTLTDACDRIAAVVGHGGRIQYVVADVTVEDDVSRAVAAAAEPAGALHGCVANAGGGGALLPQHRQDADAFMQVLRLNVLGTFHCLKHAVPAMVAGGGGSFVGMSSIAGHLTHPYFGAYPAAKAGIEQLVRNAADEYGAAGVRFNAVRPGFIATELMSAIPRDSSVFASYVDNTPLGRLGEPSDVAGLVRFLIGADSAWMTGAVIDLDGGHSLRRGPDYSPFVPPTPS
jgi:NAD(P)-dependent dehydrogenase (short-subunit alcohol dehydrogenase family)